jgi:hypothetical protein
LAGEIFPNRFFIWQGENEPYRILFYNFTRCQPSDSYKDDSRKNGERFIESTIQKPVE